MGKKDEYRSSIETILDGSATVSSQLANFLSSNSRLPGPRANLELLDAFSSVVGERCRRSPERFWNLSMRFSESPYEFVAMCGVRGVGAVGARLHEFSGRALEQLEVSAVNPSWRVREAVAMGLQDIMEADTNVAKRLERWVSQGDWLRMRAVAAGVAEPRLLKDDDMAAIALGLHREIFEKITGSEDRKSEEFRVLRQALGYSLSVVVASSPKSGFPYMKALILHRDPDVLWICRESLKTDRLASHHPDQVRELRSIIG
jgi:hypothetical protein